MLKEINLHLFDTGYCLNFAKMVARHKPLKLQRFYALVGLIEHPTLGPILFDTGYSSHLLNLCRRLPYVFYKLITPIRFEDTFSAAMQIQKFGYQPQDIKHIIISHFHPDHIGGLRDFPHAQFHCLKKAYLHLKESSFFQSFRAAFFRELLPNDFESRIQDIEYNPITLSLEPFTCGYDLFSDQSVVAVNLPGHAEGQFGIILKTNAQTVFLTSDACWNSDNYQYLEYPHPIAKMAINDYPVFCNTLQKLKAFKENYPHIEIIPSHCHRMWERYVKEGRAC